MNEFIDSFFIYMYENLAIRQSSINGWTRVGII